MQNNKGGEVACNMSVASYNDSGFNLLLESVSKRSVPSRFGKPYKRL